VHCLTWSGGHPSAATKQTCDGHWKLSVVGSRHRTRLAASSDFWLRRHRSSTVAGASPHPTARRAGADRRTVRRGRPDPVRSSTFRARQRLKSLGGRDWSSSSWISRTSWLDYVMTIERCISGVGVIDIDQASLPSTFILSFSIRDKAYLHSDNYYTVVIQ